MGYFILLLSFERGQDSCFLFFSLSYLTATFNIVSLDQ